MSSPATDFKRRIRWIAHWVASTTFVSDVLPAAGSKARDFARLMRLDKPIGIYLLLWPVLWALWLSSDGFPDEHAFIVFVLGTIVTRCAGCTINDYADRDFDAKVMRTQDRPIATGRIDPIEALGVFVGLGLVAIGLVLTMNHRTQLYAVFGALLIVTYPFMKRFFPLPQFYLGAAFTWGVPMVYAAQMNAVPRLAWLLFLAGLLWTMAYDTMYAMVDRDDDLKIGIKSSAIFFGDADRFIIGVMQLMSLLALWLVGHDLKLGAWYQGGLIVAATFSLYQQVLIRNRERDKCFTAFLNNNYFGMAVFAGIALEYLFR